MNMCTRMPCGIMDGLQYDDWLEGGDSEVDEDDAYERWRSYNIDDRMAPNYKGNPMILLGIHGKGGSGKDTVGEILKDNHDFAITAFAWPIKIMICSLLGVDVDKWNDRVWRELPISKYGGVSPRYMAQTIGTEWGRNIIDPDLWLNVTMNKVRELSWPKVAITDVRFDNEAEYIRDNGGYVIIVHRGESDLHVNAQAHCSEIGLSEYGDEGYIHINNYGTLKELEVQVAIAVEQILEEENRLEEIQSHNDGAARAGV